MSGGCIFSFGGANVQRGHFFEANGNINSQTRNNGVGIESIGNAFVLPVRMRIIGFAFQKATQTPGEFGLMNNGAFMASFNVSGSSGYTPVQSVHEWSAYSNLRMYAVQTNADNTFRSCLIALYFVPVRSNPDYLGERYLNVIPFGGNVPIERRFTMLRYGAQATTGLDTSMNFVEQCSRSRHQ